MKSCLVFSGQSSLDFCDVRMGIVRIPEVLTKLKELQENWDILFKTSIFSVLNYTCIEDKIFHQNKGLKNLIKATIQAGLYERHLKSVHKHQYIVGPKNKDSALLIALGEMSVRDLVFSYFEKEQAKKMPSSNSSTTQLMGESMTTYCAYKWSEEKLSYEEVEMEETSEKAVYTKLAEDENVKRYINIGPGNEGLYQWYSDMAQRDFQYVESIDIDPMLNWFWQSLKEVEAVVAAQ